MANADDENGQKVLEYWNGLPETIQKTITFDCLLIKADVDPIPFIEKLASTMYTIGVNIGNVIAAAYHPEIVKAGAKRALQPLGTTDRKMIFDHHGFLPQRKGSTVKIGIVNNNQASAQAAASDADDKGLPSLESETLAMRPLVRQTVPLLTGDPE